LHPGRNPINVAAIQSRLAFAVVMASWLGAFGVFASWGLASAIICGVGILLFLPRLEPGYRPVPRLWSRGGNKIVAFSFANYISTGLWSAPVWLIPVIVLNLLGQEANAYSFISWAIAGHIFAIPLATSQSLFSAGSNQEQLLGRDARRSLKFMVVLLIPAIVITIILADKLLLLFGKEYSVEGTKLLWILTFSTLPTSVNLLYLGVARVRKQLRNIILVSAAMALLTLALSYALIPFLGLVGPGVAWLTSNVLVALATFPGLLKVIVQNGPPLKVKNFTGARPETP
jgi:O-antigen/teichoic acid export membrane protein